jgi:hypothetical protein
MDRVRVAQGDDACDEHEWVTDEQVTASDESHVVKVCRCCSAVAVIGPDLPFDWV